jgi:hypothetical protein
LISTELKSKKNYFFFFAAFLTAFFAAFFGAFLAAFFLVAMCGSPPSGWVQIRNVEQNKLEKVLGNFLEVSSVPARKKSEVPERWESLKGPYSLAEALIERSRRREVQTAAEADK